MDKRNRNKWVVGGDVGLCRSLLDNFRPGAYLS